VTVLPAILRVHWWNGSDCLGGVQEPADGADQTSQRLPVDAVSPAEVMDDFRLRYPGVGVPLVVGQRQVGDLAAVRVTPFRLPQIHPAYDSSHTDYRNPGYLVLKQAIPA